MLGSINIDSRKEVENKLLNLYQNPTYLVRFCKSIFILAQVEYIRLVCIITILTTHSTLMISQNFSCSSYVLIVNIAFGSYNKSFVCAYLVHKQLYERKKKKY